MKNHLKHLLLVAVLAIVGTVTAVAQSTLRGKVVDAENNEPLIGATVTVNGVKVATDIDGAFTVKGVKGTAEITVDYIGYKSKSMKTNASKGDIATISLKPDGLRWLCLPFRSRSSRRKSEHRSSPKFSSLPLACMPTKRVVAMATLRYTCVDSTTPTSP